MKNKIKETKILIENMVTLWYISFENKTKLTHRIKAECHGSKTLESRSAECGARYGHRKQFSFCFKIVTVDVGGDIQRSVSGFYLAGAKMD